MVSSIRMITLLPIMLLVLSCIRIEFTSAEYNCEYKKDGFYSDEDFCHIYWRCNYGVAEEYECPAGTAWNHIESRCDWLDNVDCSRVDDGSKKKEKDGDEDGDNEDNAAETTKKPKKGAKPSKTTESSETNNEEKNAIEEKKTANNKNLRAIVMSRGVVAKKSRSPAATTSTAPEKSIEESIEEISAFDYDALCASLSIASSFASDPFICNRYVRCNHGYAQKFRCSQHTAWDADRKICLWTREVKCGARRLMPDEILILLESSSSSSSNKQRNNSTTKFTMPTTEETSSSTSSSTSSFSSSSSAASATAFSTTVIIPATTIANLFQSTNKITFTETAAANNSFISTTTASLIDNTSISSDTVASTTTANINPSSSTPVTIKYTTTNIITSTLILATNVLNSDAQNAAGDKQSNNQSSNTASSSNNPLCTSFGSYYTADSTNCAAYYMCNNGKETKMNCPDKQLFNTESTQCEDFQQVFCGTRPVNLADRNQCTSKRDGIYPDLERGCRVFYQCINQQKVREANCPNSLKFNSLTGRCDVSTNILAPCGSYTASNTAKSTISSKLWIESLLYLSSLFALRKIIF